MKENENTKKQLIDELEALRKHVAGPESIGEEGRRTEDVHKLKNFYELILDNVQDGFWVTDQDERMIYFNTGMEKIAGVEANEVLGLSVTTDFPTETMEHFLKYYHNAKKMRKPQFYEAKVVTPVGCTTIQSGWIIPRFEDGEYKGIICTIQDITKRKKAEEELRETKERYQGIFESANEAIFIIDMDGNIIEVNKRASEIYGYSYDEFLEINAQKLIHPDYFHIFIKHTQKLLKQKYFHTEAINICKDGREIYVNINATRMEYKGENCFLNCITDITERKQAEEELRLTQFSVDNSMDAVYWMGPDAKFIYVNKAAVEALGYSKEELLTMTVHDIGPEFPVEVWPAHWAELKEKGSFVITTTHQRKDKTIFPVEISVNLIQFGDREINCAIAKDITERKKIEEKITNLNRLLRAVIDNDNVWINVVDNEFNMVIWNKAAEAISGYSRDEVIGHGKIWEWLIPDEEYRSEVMKTAADILQNGKTVIDFQSSIISKEGDEKIIKWYSQNLVSENHETMGSIALGIDVTDFMKAEKIIQDSLEEKTVLLKEIHHRVKNNLQIISSLLDLQVDTLKNEELEEAYKTSQNRIKSMALIHETLYRGKDIW